MRHTTSCPLVVLVIVLIACTAPTEPTAPFATWQLQQLNGTDLPVTIGSGASAVQLLADTLDLRGKPRGDAPAGSLVFVTRDAAGIVSRNRVTIGYRIANGRIAIDFHCLYNQVCYTIYSPLTALIDGDQLLFQDATARESRLYHLVE